MNLSKLRLVVIRCVCCLEKYLGIVGSHYCSYCENEHPNRWLPKPTSCRGE